MSLKATSKITKGVGKNFIEKFQKSIPLSSSLHAANASKALVNDTERMKLRDFMKIANEDNTKIGQDFKADLEKMRSLSYVNEIANKPEKKKFKAQQFYNRAEEVNKKFALNKVEPSKNSIRTGILGYKVGMTIAWDKHGIQFPLTVVKIDNCQVTQVKTVESDKCNALQLGMGHIEPHRVTKAMVGHFIKNNISPKRHLRQFRVTPENSLPVGYMLTARHYIPGQFVDVVAFSKGRGFQGVMYRWNFKGLFATHGCSIKHRAAGSIGNREFPGKVWKGKKMAGQMGNDRMTVQNLLVFRTDYKRNLLFIKGSLPGRADGIVYIKDAIKKYDQWKKLLYPTYIPEEGKALPNLLEWEESQDLNEKYTHDNDEVLGVSEEEEEGEPEKNADDDSTAKK